MSEADFQRARSSEQKEERRTLLLDAARTLLMENPADRELSLNEVARRAGMAKSNVYRYFESREAIMLELLRQAWGTWFVELQAEFAKAPVALTPPSHRRGASKLERTSRPTPIDQVATKLANTFARQPLLGHLCSILASVLERNVEVATVRSFKLESLEFVKGLAEFLHGQYSELSVATYEELFHTSFAAMVGLWPLSHPSEAVAALLQEPEFAPFRHDFAQDFARHLSLLARGLASAPSKE